MRRAFIVLNPVAGASDPDDVKRHIQQHFDGSEWHYDIYITTGEENLVEVTQRALDDDPDLCIAIGGDGTVSGVASGLVNTDTPLGIVPTGTGNLLATQLGIPENVPKALKLLAQTSPDIHTFDALRVEDRYFFLNISLGTSARIMSETSREDKRDLGFLAYIKSALQAFFDLPTYSFEMTLDQQDMHTRATEVIVANKVTSGIKSLEILPISPEHTDHIAVFVIRGRTLRAFFRLLWALVTGQESHNEDVYIADVHEDISISADQDAVIQGDGEVIGHQAIQVQVVPQAVRICVPSAASFNADS